MYECPSCGGDLRFDIPSQMLKCEHCDSVFDSYAVNKEQDAEERVITKDASEFRDSEAVVGSDGAAAASGIGENAINTGDEPVKNGVSVSSDASESDTETKKADEFQVTIFTCASCGAEISSTNLSAAGFCSYCGQPAVFSSRVTKERRPEKIIPFKIDKSTCKDRFIKRMKGALYAPKELTDPDALSNFVGIYMPYWIYDFTVGPRVVVPVQRSKRNGNYIYTDKYDLDIDMSGEFVGMAFDASSSFSDHIAEVIAPYDAKDMIDFTPSFLCGFYADISDVPSETYQDDAEAAVINYSYQQIDDVCRKKNFERSGHNVNQFNAKTVTNLQYAGEKEAMLPVWFLTYRKDERVCYSVVNGVTGKISSDIPVDYKKFAIATFFIAIPIFLMLNLQFTIPAKATLIISMILNLIVLILYITELSHLDTKDSLSEDQGYAAVRAKGKLGSGDKVQSNAFKSLGNKLAPKEKGGGCVSVIAVVMAAYWCIEVALGAIYVVIEYWPVIVFGLIVALIWFGVVTLKDRIKKENADAKKAGGKKNKVKRNRAYGYYELIGIVMGFIVTGAVLMWSPIDDIIYYGASTLAFAGIVITISGMIRKYNILSTHPIPEYFDRNGGNVHA